MRNFPLDFHDKSGALSQSFFFSKFTYLVQQIHEKFGDFHGSRFQRRKSHVKKATLFPPLLREVLGEQRDADAIVVARISFPPLRPTTRSCVAISPHFEAALAAADSKIYGRGREIREFVRRKVEM